MRGRAGARRSPGAGDRREPRLPGSQRPVSGGGFSHAYLGFGRRQAYLRGWFLNLSYICPVAPNASALALLARILPAASARLHPVHDTPQAGILFTGAFCLAAPWFGREALLWIVRMSVVGMTVAYFYSCVVVCRMFR